MINRVLHFSDLQRLARPDGPPPRLSTVVRWANQQGIRFRYDGAGGIWTTIDALNVALGLDSSPKYDEVDVKELI